PVDRYWRMDLYVIHRDRDRYQSRRRPPDPSRRHHLSGQRHHPSRPVRALHLGGRLPPASRERRLRARLCPLRTVLHRPADVGGPVLMARCGCNTVQSTTCEAIMACIVANLGPGLDYNEQTRQIEVRISTDAGNAARFGSDGDLYAPVATAPGPIQWPVTVATLPAQAIAATGGSNTVLPSTSPQAIEYAAANRIDIYATSVCAMDDGVALEVIANRDSNSSTYLDNPSVVAWHQVGSVAVPSMVYDAGTRVSPTARNAPSDFTDPDGGWAGFYSHPYAVRTVAELLRIVRGRMVVAMFVRLEGLTDDAQAVAAVESVVNAVVAAGAQDWVIIMPQDVLDDGTRVPL